MIYDMQKWREACKRRNATIDECLTAVRSFKPGRNSYDASLIIAICIALEALKEGK